MLEAKLYEGKGRPIALCGCRYCVRMAEIRRVEAGFDADEDYGFSVCRECGNKRCPHDSYHGHPCTRSNESGQHGSVYGDFELPELPDDGEDWF